MNIQNIIFAPDLRSGTILPAEYLQYFLIGIFNFLIGVLLGELEAAPPKIVGEVGERARILPAHLQSNRS